MFQSLTGIEYLKAEIACKHDKAYEKQTWDKRIDHYNELDFSDPDTFKKASNPIGLRAATNAMKDTHNNVPTGYMISLDACSSGLQILSLLVSCPKSFDLCGGDSDNCVDSYTTIYNSMNLHGALTRKEVKKAIMTSLYGSVATPEMTFGENVDIFYDTMESMAPGAWELNIALQELWDDIEGSSYTWIMPDNFNACIETKSKVNVPFNMLGVNYKLPVSIDERPEFHKGLGPNLIHSVDGFVVREMFRRCMYDQTRITDLMMMLSKNKEVKSSKPKYDNMMVAELWMNFCSSGFLSSRILDHLSSENIEMVDSLVIAKLIQSLPEKPFDMVSVHDCFRCHPNYGNDLRIQYNTIMCDIKNSEILSSMCSQVTESTLKVQKVGTIKDETILEGNYLLA